MCEAARSVKSAPAHTSEILSRVNIFSQDQYSVRPEPSIGPFICDESIKLSPDELKILSRGPKFMVREELSSDEFDLEVEKMVAKQKFNDAFKSEDDLSSATTMQDTAQYIRTNADGQTKPVTSNQKLGEHDFNVKWAEYSGEMVYNEVDKVVDLGNLRASAYKYNKEIFVPENKIPVV